jgi:OmcA/MtrC family decaheme c-type cytochrome
LATKNVFRDFAISGSVTARRSVVEIDKCNVCHASLSLHGNNRSNEIGVCTVCHNPDATDAARRPVGGGVDGLAEQSIDFKTMIHGIHAGQADKGGMRDKGITIYGIGGTMNDFSDVVFPGRLSDCTTCHTPTSYRIAGIWATPQASGIGGTTIASGASATDPADNLRMSPTAAVCLSCHDRRTARLHMQDTFLGAVLSATQADLVASGGENCAFCHGEGRIYDVKTMHGVK